jgi:hypothetical protein
MESKYIACWKEFCCSTASPLPSPQHAKELEISSVVQRLTSCSKLLHSNLFPRICDFHHPVEDEEGEGGGGYNR